MNVLDENIFELHRQQLEAWNIRVRQLGVDIGKLGMDDREEIIPLLHGLRRPTFFTRDKDFYHRWLRHPGYCLVYLDVTPDEAAQFIHRFLRHSNFRTQADIDSSNGIFRFTDFIKCLLISAGTFSK